MGTTATVAEAFLDGLYFGEGPRWHGTRLWYSDFFDEAVYSVDEGGERRLEASVPGRPSGLGWLPDGRLLVVCMLDRLVLRREDDGTLARHGDLRPWATFHGNDMVVDGEGRAYVGNFGFDLDGMLAGRATPSTASIVRVDPDGTSQEAAAGLSFPNGSVLFPDGRTMVVAESFAGQLSAFDVAPDGTLSGRRVWAALEGCAPDGICLDAEGCIWVANAASPECRRVAEGGETLEVVTTSRPCYACMLGGADRRTLYCMTAQTSGEPEVAAARNGRIERARVGVAGAGLP
jgi:sugar lactone lactonase YvrE